MRVDFSVSRSGHISVSAGLCQLIAFDHFGLNHDGIGHFLCLDVHDRGVLEGVDGGFLLCSVFSPGDRHRLEVIIAKGEMMVSFQNL